MLAGDVSPSGILPYTMYPARYLDEVAHQDMSMRTPPGRSYRFYTGQPLWPFGFSLSYTTWGVAWAGVREQAVETKHQLRGRSFLDSFGLSPRTPHGGASYPQTCRSPNEIEVAAAHVLPNFS